MLRQVQLPRRHQRHLAAASGQRVPAQADGSGVDEAAARSGEALPHDARRHAVLLAHAEHVDAARVAAGEAQQQPQPQLEEEAPGRDLLAEDVGEAEHEAPWRLPPVPEQLVQGGRAAWRGGEGGGTELEAGDLEHDVPGPHHRHAEHEHHPAAEVEAGEALLSEDRPHAAPGLQPHQARDGLRDAALAVLLRQRPAAPPALPRLLPGLDWAEHLQSASHH